MSDPGWILALVGCLLEPWTAGSTLFVHHLAQLDPKVIVQVLFKYPITQFLAAPGVFRMILQEKFANLRFPTLEHCSTGGEALLPEEHEQWRRHTGLLLHELYGQSETVGARAARAPGRVGLVLLRAVLSPTVWPSLLRANRRLQGS
ncbi:acyl-coenzyme A synthetase ACSM1, mitochondrial [Ictidomys tridecemlineatus]|nr:acyl-coenzyme A synthetase ACSM1, mitochondrial [Ictidomys tridecemlineatus]